MTVADLVRARADDRNVALRFEDESWTYAEYVAAVAERASLLRALLSGSRPPHVGVLLDNVPEFTFWLGAAAVSGAVVVGLNSTRSAPELAGDARHTDCQVVVTDVEGGRALEGYDLGADLVLEVGGPAYAASLAAHAGAALPDVEVDPGALALLLFTSGTGGRPKAVKCSQGRLAMIAGRVVEMFQLTPDDVCYAAMPMFHSNAIMAGWAPALAAGATVALRRRFSASGFLPDVRQHGVTYFNYVGKPLSYILATPERPDDAENTLTRVFGNEAAEADITRFGERFGCHVVDAYGSTEGGASIARVDGMPAGALGQVSDVVTVLDAETGQECPPARFDAGGVLLNADEAVGEIVNRAGFFEGYYNHDEADAQRMRGGAYWTGDLGYRDADGWLYFAGRADDWLRVDGENFAAAPVARILERHPDVVLAVVYAVPDDVVGDAVMCALQLRPGATLDAESFGAWLREQRDLGTKWAPRYVRVCDELPITATSKVLVRQLRTEKWDCSDDVWVRLSKELQYQPL